MSWPKKKSGKVYKIDGNMVRQVGLEAGLFDNKVCSFDEIWSGLKFVYRTKDRN